MAYPGYKNQKITKELFSATKSQNIELLEISKIKGFDGSIRFHGGLNGIYETIKFEGEEYYYIPYEGVDFGTRGDGGIQRPRLKLINYQGFFSKFIIDRDDLLKAEVKRKRTFLRFLDKDNFANYDADKDYWDSQGITPDEEAQLRPDVWYINHKVEESKYYIEWELANALDLENVTIPRRKIINNYCEWKYRGKCCNYEGNPIADSNNVKFSTEGLTNKGQWAEGVSYNPQDMVFVKTNEPNRDRDVVFICAVPHTSSKQNKPTINKTYWVMDACSKTLKGCRLRFPTGNLPFGGFPSSRLY